MNERERRRYDAFGRSQTFCTNNADDFAEGSKALACSASLASITTKLDTEKARQASASPTAKEVLLDALRLDIQNITRTARALDQDEPGFAAQFRPPETSGQGALLTATDAILARLKVQPDDDAATKKAKAALAARFVAHELPEDFVQNLADDRAAIDAAQDAMEDADNDGVESTAAIGKLIKDGMKELTTLDAIMHNKYARVPEKLRTWQSASHIERAPQREKKPALTVLPAAPAAPQSKVA